MSSEEIEEKREREKVFCYGVCVNMAASPLSFDTKEETQCLMPGYTLHVTLARQSVSD